MCSNSTTGKRAQECDISCTVEHNHLHLSPLELKICLYLNFRNLWNVKFEAKYPSSLSRFQFLQNERSQTNPKKKHLDMSNLCCSRLQISPPYFLPGRAGSIRQSRYLHFVPLQSLGLSSDTRYPPHCPVSR